MTGRLDGKIGRWPVTSASDASGACRARARGFGIGIGTGIGAGLLENTIQGLLSNDTLCATLFRFLVGFPLKISGLADFVCCLCKCSFFLSFSTSNPPSLSHWGPHSFDYHFLLLGRAPKNSALKSTMGPWSQLSWSCVLLSINFITPSLGAVITARAGSASVAVVPELPGACRAVIS